MTCRRVITAFDERGRRTLDADTVAALDAHAGECADCAREWNRRQIMRLAFDVAAPAAPEGSARALVAAMPEVMRRAAERRAHPDLADVLAELVFVIRGLWPKLALAAALLLTIGLAWPLPSRPNPEPLLLATLAPAPSRFDDVILDALLGSKGNLP